MAIQGDLKCVHLYENQIQPAMDMFQLDCFKYQNCELEIKSFENFENLLPSDFKLLNYDSYQAVKVEMLAPKEIWKKNTVVNRLSILLIYFTGWL